MMGSVLRAGRKLPSPSPSPSPATSPHLLHCFAPAARVSTGTLLQHNGNREFATSRVRRNDGKASFKRVEPPVSGRSKKTKVASHGWRAMRQWAKQNRCPWTWEPARTCTFADLPVTDWDTPFGVYGVARLLKLQPLQTPPGMELDLDSMSLSVETTFPDRLQSVQDFKSLNLPPYVHKALLQRAQAWARLDRYDAARLDSHISNLLLNDKPTMNNTDKRHYGMIGSNSKTLWSLTARTQKTSRRPIWAFWKDEIGPAVSPTWHVHLNGMFPRDAQVIIETHRLTKSGQGPRTLSCVWVAINAPMGHAIRDWESLAVGADPYTDAFTPVLENFARWLKKYWDKGNHRKLPYEAFSPETEPPAKLPSLSQMVPSGHVVPVVLAYRQKYIWFLWSGGIHGKLVAQYASHWLPLYEANKSGDIDTLMRYRQEALMRETNLDPRTTSEPDG